METAQAKQNEQHTSIDVNNIKVGHFQLQTKSFWLSLVSILILYLLCSYLINCKLIKDVLTHQETMLKLLIDQKDIQK